MNIRSLVALGCLVLAALTGCDRQETAWRDAQEADTVGAYQEFLQSYPESPQATEAGERIRTLQREALWQQTLEADSLEAYQQFLAEFPEGDGADQAADRIAELTSQTEWEALRDSNDLEALQAFADRYGDYPISTQARQRIEDLEAEAAAEQARLEAERRRADEAARSHRVQLAAIQSEQRAATGADMLQQQLADALGAIRIEVKQSGSLYLLVTEPLPEEDARALCNGLQASGQECLVVPR